MTLFIYKTVAIGVSPFAQDQTRFVFSMNIAQLHIQKTSGILPAAGLGTSPPAGACTLIDVSPASKREVRSVPSYEADQRAASSTRAFF
ncbi:MAG TPA: hypothetical protein VJ464_23605 [Blastocatellia bacterium]|nr:hypothetical protein [Blastocatellia bacterium]